MLIKALIVDDDQGMRKLVRTVLTGIAQLRECDDGADALRAYEVHRPDWVLMDVSMPGVDGLTATRDIIAAHPEARIAILTQHDSPALRAAASAAGACAYVLKDDLTLLPRLVSPAP